MVAISLITVAASAAGGDFYSSSTVISRTCFAIAMNIIKSNTCNIESGRGKGETCHSNSAKATTTTTTNNKQTTTKKTHLFL